MTKAAIYCRISRDRIGAGLGVQRQEEDCRALAAERGWTVVEVHTDNDLSAYSGKPRPGYRRLLDAMTAGTIDVVVAWHTDRLHRSPVELEEYITASESRGVPTHTVKAGPLDLATPSGRLVARQLGAVARYEVEHSVERQKRAKEQAAGSGRWLGGRRPYGFEADGMTVREAEAAIVREGIDALIAGASLRGLAAEWNARGLVTSTGKPWRQDTVGKMLKRARNAGLMEHRGEVVGPASWPAIVPEDRWRAACAVLADPARRTQWTSARRWLLSGLAVCGVCGAPLVCTMMSTAPRAVPSYTCREARHVVRNAAELEALVSAVVVERLSRQDAHDLLARKAPGWTPEQQAELLALRERRGALARLLADGVLTELEVRQQARELADRITALEAVLDGPGRENVLSGVVLSDDPEAAWEALDLDRKRAVIDTLMSIRVEKTAKGRPAGWKPGRSYFNPAAVTITPK